MHTVRRAAWLLAVALTAVPASPTAPITDSLETSEIGVQHYSFLSRTAPDENIYGEPIEEDVADPRVTVVLFHIWLRCFKYSDEERVVLSGHAFMEQVDKSLRGRRGSPQKQLGIDGLVDDLEILLKNAEQETVGTFQVIDTLTRKYPYVPFRLNLEISPEVFDREMEVHVLGGLESSGVGLIHPSSCRALPWGRDDPPSARPPWFQRMVGDQGPESGPGVDLVRNMGVVLPPFASLQLEMGEDRLLSMLLYHAQYHMKCLGVAWYMVYVRRSHWVRMRERLPELAGDSDILQHIQFIIWEDVTHDPRHPWASQVLTYNHALLALENERQHVLLIDIDEYLVSNVDMTEVRPYSTGSTVLLRRALTSCEGDGGKFKALGNGVRLNDPSTGVLQTCHTGWTTFSQMNTPKFIVETSPGVVGVAVHAVRTAHHDIPEVELGICFKGSKCTRPQVGAQMRAVEAAAEVALPDAGLYLLHLSGLVHDRYQMNTTEAGFLGMLDISRPLQSARRMCASN